MVFVSRKLNKKKDKNNNGIQEHVLVLSALRCSENLFMLYSTYTLYIY